MLGKNQHALGADPRITLAQYRPEYNQQGARRSRFNDNVESSADSVEIRLVGRALILKVSGDLQIEQWAAASAVFGGAKGILPGMPRRIAHIQYFPRTRNHIILFG